MSKLIDLMNKKQQLEIELDKNEIQQEILKKELNQVKEEIEQEKCSTC